MKIIFDSEEQFEKFVYMGCPSDLSFTSHCTELRKCDECWKKSEVEMVIGSNELRWHPCSYDENGMKLKHDGTWEDGKWYEWLDKYDNREIARMKKDCLDHFFPPTKIIKEQDVIAFREIN